MKKPTSSRAAKNAKYESLNIGHVVLEDEVDGDIESYIFSFI